MTLSIEERMRRARVALEKQGAREAAKRERLKAREKKEREAWRRSPKRERTLTDNLAMFESRLARKLRAGDEKGAGEARYAIDVAKRALNTLREERRAASRKRSRSKERRMPVSFRIDKTEMVKVTTRLAAVHLRVGKEPVLSEFCEAAVLALLDLDVSETVALLHHYTKYADA